MKSNGLQKKRSFRAISRRLVLIAGFLLYEKVVIAENGHWVCCSFAGDCVGHNIDNWCVKDACGVKARRAECAQLFFGLGTFHDNSFCSAEGPCEDSDTKCSPPSGNDDASLQIDQCPTLSEWGIVVMTLLMLATGTIILVRPRLARR